MPGRERLAKLHGGFPEWKGTTSPRARHPGVALWMALFPRFCRPEGVGPPQVS
ncbi:hypothetical protein AKJ09_09243 [Labilithrix luteola]|uniref:Uncharacterized protein n=1 Tax=Labilithrix luteola TaxID=1391654 RepID=A0A0K1QAY4_9BACT|nr:hypothetical protein AKJ09_09243 [Labilithrix luteola]